MLSISHKTVYRYNRPVAFGPHRLLLRPRDGHDLRLLDAHLSISPPARVHWHYDTFGNSVALAVFDQTSKRLEIRSDLSIRQYARRAELKEQDGKKTQMPVVYSDENRIDLSPYLPMEFPSEASALANWLDTAFQDRPQDITAFLRSLNAVIHASLNYSRREEFGTQTAMTTIHKKTGTCRDFAFLLMEAARLHGFAARFVTGYLHDGASNMDELTGGGSTHAWAEIFVPEAGWLEFDPTNLIDRSRALIRVAVTRTPAQATPISGTFHGDGARFEGMSVDVAVREPVDDDSDT